MPQECQDRLGETFGRKTYARLLILVRALAPRSGLGQPSLAGIAACTSSHGA